MNKYSINIIFAIAILFSSTAYGQERRIIRDVILLNVQPYEVLMTENGDVVAKLKHIPNYMESDIVIPKIETKSSVIPATKVKKQVMIAQEEPETKKYVAPKRLVSKPNFESFKEYYEIDFTKGTATLSSSVLKTLNELADVLKSNPDKKVQVFGFENESPIVASLLSKRRIDACVTYLKIKGVAVHNQVFKGSITKGTTNKVVFGFE